MKFELGDASKVGLAFGPEEVSYDVKASRLNGVPLEPVDGKISLRVLVDRPMLEICGNAGRVYITRKRASPGPSAISKVKAFVAGGHAKLVQLEVYELESIWKKSEGTIHGDSARLLDDGPFPQRRRPVQGGGGLPEIDPAGLGERPVGTE